MNKHLVLILAFILLLTGACNDTPFDLPNESNSLKGKIHVGMWSYNNSTQLSINYPNWSRPIAIDFIYCNDQCETMSTFDDKVWKRIQLDGAITQVSGEITGSMDVAAIRDPFGNIRTNSWDIQFAIPYQFLLRTGHEVIQWSDPQTSRSNLWMIGGFDQYSYLNDCWKSEDGTNWTLVTNNAAFGPRAYHQLVHMPDPSNSNKETLWLIGGSLQNESDYDVWKSTDGKKWVPVCRQVSYPRLRYFQVVTMPDPNNASKQTIWMIGGQPPWSWMSPTNQILKSIDGENWNFVVQTSPFPPRYGHQVVSMPDPSNNNRNTLWIIGGIDVDGNYLDDIWKSVDGISWSRIVPNGNFFGQRFGHQVVVMEEGDQPVLWLIGGFSRLGTFSDIWKSSDGTTWVRTANNIRSSTTFHNAVVMKDPFEGGSSVLISGGTTKTNGITIELVKTHDGVQCRTANVLDFVF